MNSLLRLSSFSKSLCFLLSCWTFVATLAFSQDPKLPEPTFKKFEQNSLILGLGRNFPALNTADRFTTSSFHLFFGIRYETSDWVLGINTHFKFLKKREDGSQLSMWVLEEETYYKIRIYHPLYLLAGGKLLYIFPTLKGMFPFKKRTDYRAEIGIAGSISLFYKMSERLGLGIYIDRWRGINTGRLHAFETGLYLTIPLYF